MNACGSIDLARAAERPWDVLVVGAGPAGSVAARQLARGGLSTLLVERKAFPRAKVCGGCVNGRAVELLREAGLAAAIVAADPIPLQRFDLRTGRRQMSFPLAGVAISRARFDAALADAAVAASATFLSSTTARIAGVGSHFRADGVTTEKTVGPKTSSDPFRAVALRQAGQAEVVAEARVVLVADGLGHASLPDSAAFRSRVASGARVGIGGTTRDETSAHARGTVSMAVGRAGYVGQVQLADGELNIAAALDPEFLRRMGPAAAVAAILRGTNLTPPRSLDAVEWQGTLSLTRRTCRPAARRLFLLGDAAGYVEPFTGEGITWAIAAALAVVPLVERAIAGWDPALECAWLTAHRELARRQGTCRALARWLRYPAAVGGALTLLSWFPLLARPILARLDSPILLGSAAP